MSELERNNWTAQAKVLLDRSAEGLDAATLSRLNRARQAALALRARRRPRAWLLGGGLASACALALAVGLWHSRVLPSDPTPVSGQDVAVIDGASGVNGNDLDLVSSDDALDFYQDLEFYAWLDAQDPDVEG